MKLWEKYCMSCPGNTGSHVYRYGYHEWNEGKWLTNFAGLVKIRNTRIKDVPRCEYQMDNIKIFLDVNFYIDEDNIVTSWLNHQGKRTIDNKININNDVLNLMFKINDSQIFYYVLKNKYEMYLYNKNTELQGYILGIR